MASISGKQSEASSYTLLDNLRSRTDLFPNVLTQSVAFQMAAFAISASDRTPGRGQRVTITAVTAEALSTTPRVYVTQPGKSTWSVAMRKVATATYRVTLTVKSGGGKGTIAFRVRARH